jgi:hypothetical protein
MNEKMVQLAIRAGLKKDHASDKEYIGDFDWRQFAELIVQECMTVTKNYTCNQGLDYSAPVALARHFGVGS